MSKVIVNCKGTDALPLEKLKPLQGNLKELSDKNYEKLKNSLVKYGFSFPFFVWKDSGNYWILDGHQRERALSKMSQEGGYDLPGKYPVVFVEAKDKKQAAELLLMQSSQFGRITEEGLYEFANTMDLNIQEVSMNVNFDAFNIHNFSAGFGPEQNPTPGETPEDRLETFLNNSIKQIVLYFQDQDYRETVEWLAKFRDQNGLEDNTAAFKHLIEFYESHRTPASPV